jgi:hypothetical protein
VTGPLFGMLRRLATVALIVGLLVTNALSLFSTAFVTAVSGVAATAGLATAQARHAAQRRAVVSRVRARVALGAARSVAEIGPQALPVVGAAAVVATTAWALADDCATLRDLSALDGEGAEAADEVCGLSRSDLTAWLGLGDANPAGDDAP